MAIRDSFTDDEWRLLLEGPAMAAATIAAASPGGGLGEMYGLLTALRDGGGAPGGNSDLINALLTTHKEELTRLLQGASGSDLPTDPQEARTEALSGTRTAAALVDQKASEGAIAAGEADAYKQFLYHVAEKVAESGKEGAFLGLFGGVRVSEAEKQALSELSVILAASPTAEGTPASTAASTGTTPPTEPAG